MSTNKTKNNTGFDNRTVLSFVREHEEPCITASEISEHFGVTNTAVHYRLGQLIEDGELCRKDVGASATVFYPVG